MDLEGCNYVKDYIENENVYSIKNKGQGQKKDVHPTESTGQPPNLATDSDAHSCAYLIHPLSS